MGKRKEKEKMLNFKNLVSIAPFVTIFLSVVVDITLAETIEGGKRTYTVVEFDPYVSVLDRYNPSRYNVTDLVPMVRTIATEFDKVVVFLSGKAMRDYFESGIVKSIHLCPSAVAMYNIERDKSQPKIEVWLVLADAEETHFSHIFQLLVNIANEANKIHNETVTRIVCHVDILSQVFKANPQKQALLRRLNDIRKKYKFGLYITSTCNLNHIHTIKLIQPDFILLLIYDFAINTDYLGSCIVLGAQPEVVYSVSTSVVDGLGKVNMTRLVWKWNEWRKMAEDGNASVVISKAFDTYFNQHNHYVLHQETAGWWRLKENVSRIGNYYFEAKHLIAEKFDRDENSTNLSKITTENENPSDYVGVILQVIGTDARRFGDKQSVYAKQIVKLTETKYHKIALYLDDLSSFYDFYEQFLYSNSNSIRNGNVILLLPFRDLLETPGIELLRYLINQTFIFEFDTNEFIAHKNVSRHISSALTLKQKGYSFAIKYCTMFPLLDDNQKTEILSALNESDVAVFYFAEDKDTVKLGVRRMFDERVVQFEECRRFLTSANKHNNKTGLVELTFVMLHYAHSKYFYRNPLPVYNFVLYWKMIAAWAHEKNTTVIMNNADDSKRVYDGETYLELGWWRAADEFSDGTIEYIDKETDLRQLLPEKEEQPQEIPPRSANEVIISSAVTGIILVFVFALALVMLRRRLKETHISRNEIAEFFHGASNNRSNMDPRLDLECLPYDKPRFEIESKCFVVDENKPLGSGEFGLVCAAKVETSPSVFLNSAVKMVNSAKFHKTTLTGLLSEIKVLAYLGKHDNLIELVGASTSQLKQGKVFVFLELCPLGSLEKYLRAIGPSPTEDHLVVENEIDLRDLHNYANVTAERSSLLDPSISEDLYRWSKEICNGMSFLASKHVVHADLATRNVLLNLEKTAKICDFGLSRRMYNYANYVKQHQEPLPWKWMPPESLSRMEFNEKSDVWAYGVTLWEMYSLGDTPYPGLSWAPTFFQMLERGFRMGRPKYAERNIYSIIEDCWKTSSDNRPSFAELLQRFTDISSDEA